MQWVEQELGKLTQGTNYVREFQKVDWKKGKYLSASRTFQEQGGTPADLEATKKLLERCFTMGPPFVSWNSFTERWDILNFEQGMTEVHKRSWEIWKRTEGADDADASGHNGQAVNKLLFFFKKKRAAKSIVQLFKINVMLKPEAAGSAEPKPDGGQEPDDGAGDHVQAPAAAVRKSAKGRGRAGSKTSSSKAGGRPPSGSPGLEPQPAKRGRGSTAGSLSRGASSARLGEYASPPTEPKKLVAKALQIKREYGEVRSAAEQLKTNIKESAETAAEWSWAKSEEIRLEMQKGLISAEQGLQSKMDPFAFEFVVMGAAVSDKYDETTWLGHCRHFCGLERQIAAVRDEVDSLVAMCFHMCRRRG